MEVCGFTPSTLVISIYCPNTRLTSLSRTLGDRRARNTAIQAVTENQKLSGKEKPKPVYAVEFSKEEVANEARRPKRKVAVMIGYSGTGYKGMQL